MEKALTAVGQGMANMGGRDPRKQTPGAVHNHPLLSSFLKALRDEDDPSTRAYPANLTIIRALRRALDTSDPTWGVLNAHVIDLIIVAFFWLLRPAEYALSAEASARTQAFEFQHINLTIDGQPYLAPVAPLHDAQVVQRVTHAFLTFADQKNAVRGELVGHAANNDPFYCPAKALARVARRLKLAGATPSTPIHHHYNKATRKWYPVKTQFITNALRHAADLIQEQTGIIPDLLSARSLRPGGATSLMLAGVDSDHIALLGRWHSDSMFRYLRIQVAAHTGHYSQRMLDHGSFTFTPGTYRQPLCLPAETPKRFRDILEHAEFYDA